ncbi:hypothetical protein F4775DRAFT_591168 [Biscogniauxia sp. FL1348]|nr:hypothetical protein F4775DRAFT_591168 [Biscogniauxia sp. FL1348]
MQRLITPRARATKPTRGLFASRPGAGSGAGHARVLTTSSSTPPPPPKSQGRDSTSEVSAKGKGGPTVADRDEELRLKMSGLSGDGGAAGVEYEDGKPVALKRGVKNNMFRYI